MIKKKNIKGVDLSFVDEIETEGGAYFDENGTKVDVIELLHQHGVNAVRLRLWHTPSGGYCNLDRTIKMAKRAKQFGMDFLLNFHYSDYWADPGKQTKPKAWKNFDREQLREAVYQYTKEVMEACNEAGVTPDMVQVGNEITNGMLWEEGKIYKQVDGEIIEDWDSITTFLRAGLDAVKDATPSNKSIKTMIHIDRGGDNEGTRKFFDQMESYSISYDVIGLSYYPWWHGSIQDFKDNLKDTALRYNKEIIVVEIAYPWVLPEEQEEEEGPYVGDHLVEGFPATPEGQRDYLKEIMKIVAEVPNGLGLGTYYWEPCWIPSKEQWSVGHANNWSHLTLFDHEGKKLIGLEAYKE
mgnify:CR=1 FL=1